MYSLKKGSFCSIWQLHGLASVTGARLQSVYPDVGQGIRNEVNRILEPREQRIGTYMEMG